MPESQTVNPESSCAPFPIATVRLFPSVWLCVGSAAFPSEAAEFPSPGVSVPPSARNSRPRTESASTSQFESGQLLASTRMMAPTWSAAPCAAVMTRVEAAATTSATATAHARTAGPGAARAAVAGRRLGIGAELSAERAG